MAKDACIGSFISVEKLERMVLDELNRLSAAYLDTDMLEQNIQICSDLQAEKQRLQGDLDAYKKKIEEYAKVIRDLYLDKVKGIITERDYIEMSRSFSVEKERLEQALSNGQEQLVKLDDRIKAGDSRKALIEQYTNLEHLTREIVEALIDYIAVGKREPGSKDVPIEIHWNF